MSDPFESFHAAYEKIVAFASEGSLRDELTLARKEYEQRTGELFETDANFERRIATFLEWYILDRPLSATPQQTPARLFIETMTPTLTTQQLGQLRALIKTTHSLFELKKQKGETLRLVDLLDGQKVEVLERRKVAGLEPGDILEARLVPYGETFTLTESVSAHDRAVRDDILKAAKKFRKAEELGKRLEFIQRVAFLANRCLRYKHVDARKIFGELHT